MSALPEFHGISAEHPWPGLMPFTEDAQAFFHGRDGETAELLRLIKREPLTVLFGQSGLGKSSLLNAGLFPRLRQEDFFPIYIRLDLSAGAPALGAQAKAIFAADLVRHGMDTRPPREAETLWEYFHDTDVDFWNARNRLLTPALVFDQFEELFTLGRHSDDMRTRCRAFIEELGDLIENRTPESVIRKLEDNADLAARLDFGKRNCRVLLSFREDFLPDFEGLRRQIRSIMQNRMRLTRMRGAAALEAITLSGGDLVAPGVAGRIVEFVAGPRASGAETGADYSHLEIEPALLSLVCRELNNKRIAAGQPRITADLIEGGAQQEIIADFYERSLADLDPRARVFVEDQLLTESGFRDSYALEDAQRLPGVTREAMDILVARRLLRLDERFGVLRIELTHDVLTGVVRESRDRRQLREADARQKEQDAARRRRTRRIAAIGAASGTGLLSLAVVFGVLAQRATVEKDRVIETQSNVLVTQANLSLESRTPRDPQAYLAKAIRLNPGNEAATARIVTLFHQRRYPQHQDERPLPESLQRSDARWLDDDRIQLGTLVIAADDLYRAWSPLRIGDKADAESTNVHVALRRVPGLALGTARQPGAEQRGLSASIPAPARRSTDRRESPAADGAAVRYDPASRTYLAGSGGSVDAVFDAATLQLLGRTSIEESDGVRAAVSRDRRMLAGYSRQRIAVRSLDGRHRVDIELPDARQKDLAAMELAPDGRVVLAWFDDRTVSAFDTGTGRVLWQQKLARGDVATEYGSFSPRGKWIALVQRNVVQLHDARTGAVHGKPLQHPARINAIAFSDDEEDLVTACQDQVARIWHAGSTSLVAPPLAHDGPVVLARFSADDAYVITASLDGTARIWSTAGELLVEPLLHEGPVIAADFSRDGKRVLTVSDGRLHVWRPNHAGRLLPAFDHGAPITAVAASPDGKRIATGTARGEVRLWKVGAAGGEPGASPLVQEASFAAHREGITGLAFNSQGTALATASVDQTARVWDAASGKPAGKPLRHRGPVRSVRFGDDGAWLLTTSADRTARLWSVADSAQRALPMRHGDAVLDIQVTRDGRFAVTGSDREIRIWDATTGALLSRLQHGVRVNAFSVSPDGTEVLAATGHEVALWKLDRSFSARPVRGEPDLRLQLRNLVWAVRYSHDGRHFAAGGLDGFVQVWARETLRPLSVPMKHNAFVTRIEFSADDRWLVTATVDRVVRVWDARAGQLVADPLRHNYDVSGVGRAPDMAWIATGDAQGSLRLWPLGLGYAGAPPEWLAPLVETVGGERVDDNGALVLIERRMTRLSQLEERARTAGGDDFWTRWSRELLRSLVRPTSPSEPQRERKGP